MVNQRSWLGTSPHGKLEVLVKRQELHLTVNQRSWLGASPHGKLGVLVKRQGLHLMVNQRSWLGTSPHGKLGVLVKRQELHLTVNQGSWLNVRILFAPVKCRCFVFAIFYTIRDIKISRKNPIQIICDINELIFLILTQDGGCPTSLNLKAYLIFIARVVIIF